MEKLAKTFPEMEINFQDALKESVEQDIDVYTKVKEDVFDEYKSRLERIGRNGRRIDDYKFESSYGNQEKFDREKISEVMLVKLRDLVEKLEKIGEERNKVKNSRK